MDTWVPAFPLHSENSVLGPTIFLLVESGWLYGNLAAATWDCTCLCSVFPAGKRRHAAQGIAGSLQAWLLTQRGFACPLKGLVSEPGGVPSASMLWGTDLSLPRNSVRDRLQDAVVGTFFEVVLVF